MARKFCKNLLTGSKKGMGHLKMHEESCMRKHGEVDTTRQTQLQWNPDGSVTTRRYDDANAREHDTLYCTNQSTDWFR